MESLKELGIKARKIVECINSGTKYIVLDKYEDEDDYSIAWVDDLEDENDGCSVRGTWDDVMDDILENYEYMSKQTKIDLDNALKDLRFA